MFSLLLVLVLIGVVFLTQPLQRLLHRIPQRYWVSLGGGISLAYVFTAFLAEVTDIQQHLIPLEVPVLGYLIEHIHLLMLLGIVTVYGLEGLAQSSKQELLLHPRVFWVHIGFFAFYNILLAYLLQHTAEEWLSCLLLTFALAIHLSIVSKDLFEQHPHLFSSRGRWLLIGSLFIGWLLGRGSLLPEIALAASIAFVAGVLIFQVLKHELPETEGHFGAFLAGVVGFAGLLVAITIIQA
ncbi:MAG: hypothetical protein Q6M54_01900 [Thermostichus sp. DRC_bins_24]